MALSNVTANVAILNNVLIRYDYSSSLTRQKMNMQAILPTNLGGIFQTTFTQIAHPIEIRVNRIYYGSTHFNVRYLDKGKVVMVDMADPYYLNQNAEGDVILRAPVPRADNAWIYLATSSWMEFVQNQAF